MATSQAAPTAIVLLAAQWPFILTVILASAVAWVFQVLLKGNSISKIPLVGGDIRDEDKRRAAYTTSARDLYMEGYHNIKNGLFRVPTSRESTTVVVHPRFLKELSNLPDDQISFNESIQESMHVKWTDLRADRDIVPHLLKRDLTPALTRLNPTIAEEVDIAFQEELPPCKDFTSVPLSPRLLRIIAKVSGRIFVGAELSRTEEYLDMSINYTLEMMNAVNAISGIKPDERDAKVGDLPELKNILQRRKRTLEFIRPLIVARKKAIAEDPDYQIPDDLITWILNGQDKYGEQSDEELSEIQLGVTFAAIHTTNITATNAFYTIAAMPELVPELREEIRTVLSEHGTFTSAALQQMKKLDSFLREVTRLWPQTFSSFSRKVLKPITLSNGQVIPAGVVIEVPSHSMMNDPGVFENAHEFDAFRSYRAREKGGLGGAEKAGVGAASQLVSINTSNLTFGYGRHACPGRFFAANELKMILGRALLDYDIKTADGATERYPNLAFQNSYVPDPTKEVMFKRVTI